MKGIIFSIFLLFSFKVFGLAILNKVYYFPFGIERLLPFSERTIEDARMINLENPIFKKLLFIIESSHSLENCSLYNENDVRVKIIENDFIAYIDKNGIVKVNKTVCKLVDRSKIDNILSKQ